MLPEYQAERQQTAQAELQAEQATQRADRLTARLRALGLDDELE